MTIPTKFDNFVPFGCFDVVKSIIESNKFACLMIVGESGNGKTTLVEQACNRSNRSLFKVQITKATTESDLFGDFRLKEGNTEYFYGSVLEAMRTGSVLLLDELTQADSIKIMCLQNVLMGGSVYVKKTGETISPSPGFCVIATGNSFGGGDVSASQVYVGEEILNEAFRDRFQAILVQEYPGKKEEEKILNKLLVTKDPKFVENLVTWAGTLRAAYKNNQIQVPMSTRRLIHIVNNVNLIGSRPMAIDMALARYEPEIREAFKGSFTLIDGSDEAKKEEDESNPF